MLVSGDSDPLRNAVTAAVRVLGLYHVAAEAGVTHQTLRKYLGGSSMRPDTMAKLQRWAAPSRESIAAGTAKPKEEKRELPLSRYEAGAMNGSGG